VRPTADTVTAPRRPLEPYLLPGVLLLTVIVRLAALLLFPDVFAFDQTGTVHGSEAYDAYAQNLLATGVYGRTPGVPDAAIPPLYSYALALVYGVFGRGYVQVGLFHTLLDAACIAMLYHIGKRLFPRGAWVGALAGVFYALYPYLVFQNLTLIDTPFFMFWLYAFLLLLVLLRARPHMDRSGWALAALAGFVLGLGLLTRPITPPLAALAGVWFLFRLSLRQTIVRLLPVALIGAAALAPWIARNYDVYGAFVPMTTTSGANFWQGNNPLTVPVFRAGYDVQWTAPDLQTADLNSREADAERFTLALDYLRQHPERVPELLWTKFLVHWSIDIAPRFNPVAGTLPPLDYQGNVTIESSDDGDMAMTGLPEGDPVEAYSTPLFDQIGRTVHRFYWGGLFLLGLAGVVASARHWRDVSLLWFAQLSMTAVYVFFHPSTRYRVPTDPLFFLFSAYALVWLWARWQARRGQPASSTSSAAHHALKP
jgi:4-amino-4-deoxy-L-arabinose transferase-like glycosyltransferase